MRRLFFLIVALCVPALVQAQPVVATSASAGGTLASSLTFAITPSGSDRYLACGVAVQDTSKTVSSITFNGTALTKLTSIDNTDDPGRQSRAEYWYLIAPSATTANVVVTLSSATAVAAGCISFTGVDQSAPHGTPASAKGDGASTSVSVSSTTGELVVDVTSIRVGTTTITAGAGQTERVEQESTTGAGCPSACPGAGNATLGMSSEDGATTTTMSWAVDDSLSKAWTAIGVALKPVSVGGGGGSTLTVCTAGCDYTNAQLQTAMNAASCSTTILLETAHVYPAPSTGWVMGDKCATPTWNSQRIRTGVTATGVVMALSLFPRDGVRVTASDALLFAKMVPTANNEAALRTVYPGETGSSCAAQPCVGSGWTVQWVEFTPKVDWAQRALVRFGTNKAGREFNGTSWVDALPGGQTQDTLREVPQYLSLIQCYLRGDPFIGQHQGLLLSSKDARVWHNVITDIKSLAETQAITGLNGIGPYDIDNNLLSATGENVIFGGADTYLRLKATVSGSPTTTSIPLSLPVWDHLDGTTEAASLSTDIYSGIIISITHGGVDYGGIECTFSGSTCTVPALAFTPSAGDTVRWCWLMGGLSFTGNHLLKKLDWFSPILQPPGGLSLTAGTGGSLSGGSHCYKVVVKGFVSAADPDVNSAASSEQCVTTSASGKVTVSWTADANARTYRVYGNGSTGTENKWWDVTAPTTQFVDTGTAGTAGSPPSSGSIFTVKNNFEAKQGDGASPMGPIVVQGNIIDYSWCCSQSNIVSIKVNNQDGKDVSVIIRGWTVRDNWIRHANRALALTCTTTGNASPQSPSGVMTDVTVTNNLFTDMSSAWVNTSGTSTNSAIFVTTGGYANEVTARGCVRVSLTHNTFLADTNNLNGPIWFNLDASADEMVDFVLRDNIMARDCSTATCSSNATTSMKTFNPNNVGQGTTAWNAATTGSSAADHNAWPDGSVGTYTAGPFTNAFFPTDAALKSTHLTNYSNCKDGSDITGCALLNTSNMHNAASDGADIGANVATIKTFTDLALSGDTGSSVDDATPNHRPRTRLRIRGGGN